MFYLESKLSGRGRHFNGSLAQAMFLAQTVAINADDIGIVWWVWGGYNDRMAEIRHDGTVAWEISTADAASLGWSKMQGPVYCSPFNLQQFDSVNNALHYIDNLMIA